MHSINEVIEILQGELRSEDELRRDLETLIHRVGLDILREKTDAAELDDAARERLQGYGHAGEPVTVASVIAAFACSLLANLAYDWLKSRLKNRSTSIDVAAGPCARAEARYDQAIEASMLTFTGRLGRPLTAEEEAATANAARSTLTKTSYDYFEELFERALGTAEPRPGEAGSVGAPEADKPTRREGDA